MAEEKSIEVRDDREPSLTKTWLIRAGILVGVFLLGLVPMLVFNWQLSSDLVAKDENVRRCRIQNTLSSATIYARRGEYETARQNASTFFTEVRQEMDKGDSGVLTAQERQGLDSVMTARDDVITLLSRNDPASAERLSNLYVEYTAAVRTK